MMTAAEYLRARDWFQFEGDDRWFRRDRMDGTTEAEAFTIELDVVETGLRLLEERRLAVRPNDGVAVVTELGSVTEPPASGEVD